MPRYHAYGVPGWHRTPQAAAAVVSPAPVTAQVKPSLKPEKPEKKES